MDLQTFLVWLISGGGSGVLSYVLLDEFAGAMESKAKRYLAIVVTSALGAGGYALAVWLGYVPRPGDAQAWIEALSPVLFTAFGLSQLVHGARDL